MLKETYVFIISIFLGGFLFAQENFNDHIQLEQISHIYTQAQKVLVLNPYEFAVGRWDSTITIYQKDGLLIDQVLISPQKKGVTMLASINHHQFVSSNDLSSIALWGHNNDFYELKNIYSYNPNYGSVDSGVLYEYKNVNYLLTGHSEGYLLMWLIQEDDLFLYSVLKIKSDNPIDSPYPLWNIQNIVVWKNGLVITASEDGDLCLINPFLGEVIHRQKYNVAAKRGINHIHLIGNYLFLANCTVGKEDKNLWLFEIEENQFLPLDAINLIQNENLEQVFSFDVNCLYIGNNFYFFCSTQEGLIWFGNLKRGLINVIGSFRLSLHGGAVIATFPNNNQLLLVNNDITLLEIAPFPAIPGENTFMFTAIDG